MTNSPHIRRLSASQTRSRERVAKIVAATQEMLIKRGYEGITIREIAATASIKSASIYRYFPNKQAILWELAEVFISAQTHAINQCVEACVLKVPWRAIIASYLEGLRKTQVQEAWIAPAQLAFRADPQLKEPHEHMLQLFNDRFHILLRSMGMTTEPTRSTRIAKMLVLCLDAYMLAIGRAPLETHPTLQEDFQELIESFLAPHIDSKETITEHAIVASDQLNIVD
jgi:AcrR family transcriptional regulator